MKTQKTVTISGARYTAQKLLNLANSHGSDFLGGDRCITLADGGEIAVRIYRTERLIAVLDYGLAARHEKKRIFAAAYKFLEIPH